MSCSCDKYPNCPCGDMRGVSEITKAQPIKVTNPVRIDDYIVPGNKSDDILDYYNKLRHKHPHITQSRLTKKVAEYFHLQKKTVEA